MAAQASAMGAAATTSATPQTQATTENFNNKAINIDQGDTTSPGLIIDNNLHRQENLSKPTAAMPIIQQQQQNLSQPIAAMPIIQQQPQNLSQPTPVNAPIPILQQ